MRLPRARRHHAVSNCPVPATYSGCETIASRTTNSASASRSATATARQSERTPLPLCASTLHRPEYRSRRRRAATSAGSSSERRAQNARMCCCAGLSRPYRSRHCCPRTWQSARMPACLPEQLLWSALGFALREASRAPTPRRTADARRIEGTIRRARSFVGSTHGCNVKWLAEVRRAHHRDLAHIEPKGFAHAGFDRGRRNKRLGTRPQKDRRFNVAGPQDHAPSAFVAATAT